MVTMTPMKGKVQEEEGKLPMKEAGEVICGRNNRRGTDAPAPPPLKKTRRNGKDKEEKEEEPGKIGKEETLEVTENGEAQVKTTKEGFTLSGEVVPEIDMESIVYTKMTNLNIFDRGPKNIKGFVVAKDDIKTWDKNGKKGRLQSFVVSDEDYNTMKVTLFNPHDDAINLIQESKWYYFLNGQLRMTPEQYASGQTLNLELVYTNAIGERIELMESQKEPTYPIWVDAKDCIYIAELAPVRRLQKICAQVIKKSEVVSFEKKPSGQQGLMFWVNVQDKKGGTIKMKFFEGAAQKYYGMVEEGQVYMFSSFTVKVANVDHNDCNSRFEIIMAKHSIIVSLEMEESTWVACGGYSQG